MSLRGVIPLSWNLDHAGPMARCVRDVAILLQFIAGYDPVDPVSVNTAVDDYLEMCAEKGKEPEKPFKGSFNIRLSPDLHQNLVLNAANQKMTLNAYIKTVLEQVVTVDQ